MSPRSRRRLGLAGLAAALVLDQATKLAALAALAPGQRVPALPALDLTLAWNRGVSFGLFGAGGVPAIVFILLSLAISGFLLWQLWKSESGLGALAFGLIVGGALGNVIDRSLYGAVVDFILIYWRDWSWPVFNIADSAITVGVVLVMIDSLWPARASTR